MLCRYLRDKMTVANPPTYSLLMWHKRQFSTELDKMNDVTQQKQSGLKLTDRCVQVCVWCMFMYVYWFALYRVSLSGYPQHSS